jgi:hypothetical protein
MLTMISENAQGHIILNIDGEDVASSKVTADMLTPDEYDFVVRNHPNSQGRLPPREEVVARHEEMRAEAMQIAAEREAAELAEKNAAIHAKVQAAAEEIVASMLAAERSKIERNANERAAELFRAQELERLETAEITARKNSR